VDRRGSKERGRRRDRRDRAREGSAAVPCPAAGRRTRRRIGALLRHNAALAIAAAGQPLAATARGLAGTTQPGCCELRGRVLLDGAHTLSSIHATLRAVADHFPGSRPELVFALAQDKDIDGIAAALAPVVAGVTCARVDERRGRTADTLAQHPAWEGRAVALENAQAALQRARDAAGPQGLVLVTGSLYLAGALRPHA
jgi:dihydrofolate synthase/folylpolyglutamate synthase